MDPKHRETNHRQCINCSFLVPRNLKLHTLEDASSAMINVLNSWIAPTLITPGGILCYECFMLIQERTPSNSAPIPERALGHPSVCFACGASILRVRKCRVPLNCDERNVILRWTPLHQVSRLESVCRACWRAATRLVQRQRQNDANRPFLEKRKDEIPEDVKPEDVKPEDVKPEDVKSEDVKPENDVIIPVPPPLHPRVQHNNVSVAAPKITSAIYRRAAGTANHCLFTGCRQPERLLVPSAIKDMLLLEHRFYVPPSARICHHHLKNGQWSELTSTFNDFTGVQFDQMLNMMERAANYHIDFRNIDNMPPHLCHYWLGMSAERFRELLSRYPRLSEVVPDSSLALSIYMVKLRTGDSNERLAALFRMGRSTLEKYMNKAKDCLTNDFVPNNFGFDHKSVKNVASCTK